MAIDTTIPDPKDIRLNESLEKENQMLRMTVAHLESEIAKFKRVPLVVCEVRKIVGDKAVVKVDNNHSFLVEIASHLIDKLQQGERVLAHQKSLTIVDTLEHAKTFDVEPYMVIEKPKVSWNEVGGLKEEVMQLREVLELPIKKPHIFKKMGVEPHKGVLLHGPSGCGKTLIAKAVAASCDFTFIEVVASELVQKYIGEGAKLVKDIFDLAREKAPAIIFIDEIDALASERTDVGSSGEREVQRTFMQLLSEIDGFKSLDNVKIVGATNRMDVLDAAILRPGRLDRLIEIGLPDERSRMEIFKIHTAKMPLARNVRLKRLSKLSEGCTGAEIRAICTEAAYHAIREGSSEVGKVHFFTALSKVKAREIFADRSYLRMFG